ncbi:MAG: M14 family metallopeptidase [Candidatus Poribacteria bacterium]|nr:M14 family metallopeptidase [Candidatus Poribacteria bacterium]
MSNTIPKPESFFGFRLGSDRKIARWDKIVDYFNLMAEESGNIQVINMGATTEGNPFLLAIISSAGNLARLDELKNINAQIADPRGLSQARISRLIKNGRAVVCQSMSLHASEIAATQMSAELAYDLVCGTDRETTEILENTIFLMIPCFNPDGQIMVTNWYNEHVGTEYEGTPLPWLYHKYCGHDNNRDAFMLNLVESQYMARIMFREWHPHVFQDHHEMGAYGARLFVVPYCEPIHPHADPLVWRELGWYGSHMAYKLEEAGIQGVVNGALFGGWAHLGFHWMGNYHNVASMLTETAQAKLATPIYIHPHQLSGDGSTLRGMPHYKAQTNFPNPWGGGWWRLRDMVEQQLVASKAVLHLAAQYRETVLSNAVQKALRQTERGGEESSAGFLIRADQHDPLTVNTLINKLLLQAIEIRKMRHQVRQGDVTYPAGTFFLPINQPKRGVIKSLLDRTFFPDDAWTRFQDGTPNRPYDTVTDTMAEMMGVTAEPVPADCTTLASKKRAFTKVTEPVTSDGKIIGSGEHGYVIDSRLNEAYRVVNKLLANDAEISRLTTEVEVGNEILPVGSFLIKDVERRELNALARTSGVLFYGVNYSLGSEMGSIKSRRIGLYNRYWGGNMDEGWTRLTLEQFGFSYVTLRDERIAAGDLNEAYEVIVFPDDSTEMIVGGDKEIEKRLENIPVPEKYRSGIGDIGVENIKAFVEDGGTLITINRACEFAIEKLGLQMQNVVKGKPNKEFFCPGSTLSVEVDTSHPLGYGMPSGALALFWDSPVFSIDGSHFNDRYDVVASYPERDILQSGWLVGEEHLSNRAAVVSVKYGVGCVILYGFRVQFRATTHGTFKLLFNGLLGE